ncbi:MAG: tetratricopeptide repeat protein, partial [bacterium]|nr:tetratricopeptide repeat protein [bacterium]
RRAHALELADLRLPDAALLAGGDAALALQRTGRLGALLMYQKQYEAAERAYSKAITLKPNQADVYSNLGMAYAALGRYSKARAMLEQALEIEPGHEISLKRLNELSRHWTRQSRALMPPEER